MEIKDRTIKNVNSKWLEGLLLLAILVAVILFAKYSEHDYTFIPDQQVSMWSGTVDNLK